MCGSIRTLTARKMEAKLPLAGVQVDLFNDGVLSPRPSPTPTAKYVFGNLLASSRYQVRFTLTDTPSTDYSFTPDCTTGYADDVDSDVTAAVGVNAAQTSFINLPLGVSDLTWDAGVVAIAVEGIQIESTTTTIAPVTTDTLAVHRIGRLRSSCCSASPSWWRARRCCSRHLAVRTTRSSRSRPWTAD